MLRQLKPMLVVILFVPQTPHCALDSNISDIKQSSDDSTAYAESKQVSDLPYNGATVRKNSTQNQDTITVRNSKNGNVLHGRRVLSVTPYNDAEHNQTSDQDTSRRQGREGHAVSFPSEVGNFANVLSFQNDTSLQELTDASYHLPSRRESKTAFLDGQKSISTTFNEWWSAGCRRNGSCFPNALLALNNNGSELKVSGSDKRAEIREDNDAKGDEFDEIEEKNGASVDEFGKFRVKNVATIDDLDDSREDGDARMDEREGVDEREGTVGMEAELKWLLARMDEQLPSSRHYISQYEDFSCQDKCGSSARVRCSCNAPCVVLGSCCFDFDYQCPGEKKKLDGELWWVKHLLFMCKHRRSVVGSCPVPGSSIFAGVVQSSNLSLSSSTTNATEIPISKTKSPNTFSAMLEEDQGNVIAKLHSLNFNDPEQIDTRSTRRPLTNAIGTEERSTNELHIPENIPFLENFPVTDSRSGITFTSPSVYQCHQHLLSTPILWEATFSQTHSKTVHNYGSVSSVLGVSEIFASNKDIYDFSTTDDLSERQLICVGNAISSCPPSFNDSRIRHGCQSDFMAYVKEQITKRNYKNPFCLACHQGLAVRMYRVEYPSYSSSNVQRNGYDLSVSMKLDFDLQSLVLENRNPRNRPIEDPSILWKRKLCDIVIPEPSVAVGNQSCKITSCVYGSVDENGQCVAKTFLNYCLPEARKPLCPTEMKKVIDDLQSSLRRKLSQSKTITVEMHRIDERSRSLIYKYNLSVLIEDVIVYDSNSNLRESIPHLIISDVYTPQVAPRRYFIMLVSGILGDSIAGHCKDGVPLFLKLADSVLLDNPALAKGGEECAESGCSRRISSSSVISTCWVLPVFTVLWVGTLKLPGCGVGLHKTDC